MVEEVKIARSWILTEARSASTARSSMGRFPRRPMKGAIGFLGATTAIAPDGTVVTMARFESAEQAAKNAARPEQTAFFEELKKYLDGEPMLHESTEVEMFLGGGSDEAGFVQFMIGTATDKAKAIASERS
jgi:hypothetical protein